MAVRTAKRPRTSRAGRTDSLPESTTLRGNVLAFSSGHIIRMIAARWHRLPPAAARIFYCNPASIGVLGFEHDSREEPIVRLWNDSIETME